MSNEQINPEEESFLDKAKKALGDLKEQAEEVWEQIEDKAEDAWDATKAKAEELKNKAGETLAGIKDKITDKDEEDNKTA